MASSLSFILVPPSVQVHRLSGAPLHLHTPARTEFLKRWDVRGMWRSKPFVSGDHMNWKRRRNLICAVRQDAEEAFKKTVEVDRLIDKLRNANPIELQKLVVENVLAFNEASGYDLRQDLILANRRMIKHDFQLDYEELAISIMSIVERLVQKTNEKIESATDVLKGILKPVVDDVEEIQWPPRDPEALKLMEKELVQREQDGKLDEGFLAEVNAQLRQAKGDGDKPGFEAMLQKVLQLYASTVLSKRSYAKKGDEILKAEKFLETIIKAPEEEWNKLLIDGLKMGNGDISPQELYAVIKKRIERTLIRTEGGSYQHVSSQSISTESNPEQSRLSKYFRDVCNSDHDRKVLRWRFGATTSHFSGMQKTSSIVKDRIWESIEV